MPENVGSKSSSIVALIAGGTAGGVESAATYPFEFAKTRVQLRNEGASGSRNPFLVIRNVVRREGVRALYTGCSAMIVGTIAKDSIRFFAFDYIKHAFVDTEDGTISPFQNLLAGMSAGVVASTFAVTPSERVKTALIDDARSPGARRFNSVTHAIRVLVRENGLKELYRGYITTTIKQAGATAFRLGSYSILKEVEQKYEIPQNTATNFANGAAAGIITTLATQPVDTIKTRAQSAKGAGTMESAMSIWNDYGVRGFWRGTTMRLGRTVFAGGILFTVYEWTSTALEVMLGHSE